MHSLTKNENDSISYGFFLSFFPAGNRDIMGVYNKKGWKGWGMKNAQNGSTELADRIRSYFTGTAPYRMPNGAISQYCPKKYQK
jgi:hypothetical protein